MPVGWVSFFNAQQFPHRCSFSLSWSGCYLLQGSDPSLSLLSSLPQHWEFWFFFFFFRHLNSLGQSCTSWSSETLTWSFAATLNKQPFHPETFFFFPQPGIIGTFHFVLLFSLKYSSIKNLSWGNKNLGFHCLVLWCWAIFLNLKFQLFKRLARSCEG